MKAFNLIFGAILVCISLSSCAIDSNDESFECDRKVVISAEEYIIAPNDQLTINSLEINGDCLTINFSSSGCSGDSWELKLIDADVILESYPPKRNLRLSLKNEELCDAFITREIIFDIYKLQVDRNQVFGKKVKLNITNSDDQILYKY